MSVGARLATVGFALLAVCAIVLLFVIAVAVDPRDQGPAVAMTLAGVVGFVGLLFVVVGVSQPSR